MKRFIRTFVQKDINNKQESPKIDKSGNPQKDSV